MTKGITPLVRNSSSREKDLFVGSWMWKFCGNAVSEVMEMTCGITDRAPALEQYINWQRTRNLHHQGVEVSTGICSRIGIRALGYKGMKHWGCQACINHRIFNGTSFWMRKLAGDCSAFGMK